MSIKTTERAVQAAMLEIGLKQGREDIGYSKEEIKFYSQVYSLKSRLYHVLDHIEEIMDARSRLLRKRMSSKDYLFSSAIQAVAGFKHDIFQLSIDQSVPEGLEWVFDYKKFADTQEYTIKKPDRISNKIYNTVLAIFGYEEGKKWQFENQAGLNEFLTALETAHELSKKGIELKHIVAVVACIEASVAFRSKDKTSALCRRINTLDLGLSKENIELIGITAADFANRDVANFRGNFFEFINNTRLLIPELNPSVRSNTKVEDSRDCFLGVIKLMKGVAAGIMPVFCQHKNFPPDKKLARWEERAQKNAEKAESYLQARYIAATFLLAQAVSHGKKDSNITSLAEGSEKLLDHITPAGDHVLKALCGHDMTKIEGFDLSAAPTAAFIYSKLGAEKIAQLFNKLENREIKTKPQATKCLGDIKDMLGITGCAPLEKCFQALAK